MTTRRTRLCAAGLADSVRRVSGHPFPDSAFPTATRALRSRRPDRWVALLRARWCAVHARSVPLRPSRPKSPSRRRLHRKSMEPCSDRRSEWHVALISIEEHLHLQDVLLYNSGCEIAIDREGLETGERQARARLVFPDGVKRSQELDFLGRGQADESR